MAWRNASLCAEHLGIRKARFLALVRAGRLPPPSYILGERSPRWRLEDLDNAMSGSAGTDAALESLHAYIKKMEEKAGRVVPRRKTDKVTASRPVVVLTGQNEHSETNHGRNTVVARFLDKAT